MAEPEQNEAAESCSWLMEEWALRLGQVLEAMTGEQPVVGWAPALPPVAETSAAEGATLWWAQAFSLAPEPAVWVGAPEPVWQDLGNRALRAAGMEAGQPAEVRNTYLEILGQSLAGLAQGLSARANQEVVCRKGEERAGPPATGDFFSVAVHYGEAVLPPVWVTVTPALRREIEAANPVPRTPPGEVAAAPPGAATGAAHPSSGHAPASKTLDRLLDVELPLSVSFGCAQLAFKEVLKLTTGSIVELNCTVSEPVEVIVNNCVIARGEVVVVDGNYGVRIQQILSRQERLRTSSPPTPHAEPGNPG